MVFSLTNQGKATLTTRQVQPTDVEPVGTNARSQRLHHLIDKTKKDKTMRTATTKQAEVSPFIKMPTSYIIRGALRVIYSRHHEAINITVLIVLNVIGWTWGFMQWLG